MVQVNRLGTCLADISAWMSTHHLKLNLGKTELLFLLAKDSPMIDASITVEGSIVSPPQSARSLGALVISRLDYCNSLLAGLLACAIKPLQLVQNAAARLVINQLKFTHVTPLLSSLHWLPIAARIRFKSLVLAFQATRVSLYWRKMAAVAFTQMPGKVIRFITHQLIQGVDEFISHSGHGSPLRLEDVFWNACSRPTNYGLKKPVQPVLQQESHSSSAGNMCGRYLRFETRLCQTGPGWEPRSGGGVWLSAPGGGGRVSRHELIEKCEGASPESGWPNSISEEAEIAALRELACTVKTGGELLIIVVALPRPIRPQELKLRSDAADDAPAAGETVVSASAVDIRATDRTYMPSSNGSTRSLSCGCSSASCCTVTAYGKDGQKNAQPRPRRPRPPPPPPPPPPRPPSPVRVIYPNELARKMTRCPKGHPVAGPAAAPVIIDCRPFTEYNRSHVRGAVHINCSDKISRRRLQQGKITVLDLISCREGRDSFTGLFSKEIVVYDESTSDPCRVTPSQPLHVVLESLRREGKDPIVLKEGGPQQPRRRWTQAGGDGYVGRGAVPHALPTTPDIENAELTSILPFLFLGNERDAQDLGQMQRLNIGFVLNVTTHLPLFHYERDPLSYKRLPATDSNKQNLRQYFEEAFEFIEEAHQAGQGLLIHCQAGVSRSATIVIAYLMKHTWMTMTDAYKFVKARRPIISPNLNFMGQLLEFEEDLNNGVTPRILSPKLVGVETIV
ncbi:hypothetical protein AAFF_G00088580 [Aldrovandia affinis]|uniref:Dual specificity protein phosphatase 10 n=1 Tax=Aldrovandia affinis TaxID=143900 RepID=A0AAD7RYW0_9TELE|nr:hypothetical protein AAFF_G00088580 [Aldrovandia affinis]